MKVPLVDYSSGERKVIGEADIDDNYQIVSAKLDDGIELAEVLKTGFVFGTSLSDAEYQIVSE